MICTPRSNYSLLFLLFMTVSTLLTAQETYPYNGVYDQREGAYALTGGTVHISPTQTLEEATIVIRDGRIVSVSRNGSVPAGAVEIELNGKHVYPSFIETYGKYGMPKVKAGSAGRGDGPQLDPTTEGAYAWNDALKSQNDAADLFTIDAKAAGALRAAGFGLVSTHLHDGISRGSAAVVSLAETNENEVIIQPRAAHHLSLSRGSSKQEYPTSQMGAMALLRQTYHDADWYGRQRGRETNLSLEAWRNLQSLPQIIGIGDWQDLLQVVALGKEFDKNYIVRGGGDEYQHIDAVKASGATVIVPIKFPDAYDVADPFAAELITLGQLRHWERAPSNVAALIAAEVPFVLSTNKQKQMSDFPAAVRKAVKAGADPAAVLAALTTTPAELLGIADRAGTIEQGKLANFFVTDKDFFTEEATIYQHWVQGNPYAIKRLDEPILASGYDLNIGQDSYKLNVSGDTGKQKIKVQLDGDTTGVDATFSEQDGVLSLRFQPNGEPGFVRLNATPDGEGGYYGTGRGARGEYVSFTATPSQPSAPATAPDEKGDDDTPDYVSQLTYPNIAYGNTEIPRAERVLFRNATVWTNEDDGILEETDVLIEDGKIQRVGRGLTAGNARVIDATGMHLTSGIIDEHSHIALKSVNEAAQASSAEVRMSDVVDAVDENIYRQLAGGVTVSQLLHGSANPIGGQSAIVKLRWGMTPRQMMLEGADPFIKFALGENVKQSNWGDDYTLRYPQTRMGVEQIFESYFSRAAEYDRAMKAGGNDFRRDLDLEALNEILNGERFITCHSYQQGEINMLMQLAERHDFRVNTFTHILEGYKVADKMAEHGAAGSTFSDWWAYKYEVNEAIPYNGAIMHDQGVVTAFNSDDAEMARRLNQEAAKAVLFGGVSEAEAWKFVTLNPAKMLHLDDRIGSIRAGKDADLVVWNDHPMSIYARAEHTFVDGREYFNRADYEQKRKALAEERNALIQKSLNAKKAGEKTQPAEGKQRRLLHCDSLDTHESHHRH